MNDGLALDVSSLSLTSAPSLGTQLSRPGFGGVRGWRDNEAQDFAAGQGSG